MAFVHAIHIVLYGLLVLANLLLIPIVAMVGFNIGESFGVLLTQDPDLLRLLPVVAAFMAVGLVNGPLALLVLHNIPTLPGGASSPDAKAGARKK